MITTGMHARYDLTDLMAGIARTDRRDRIIDRTVAGALIFFTGTTIGLLTGLALSWPW